MFPYLCGTPRANGFGSASTAEQVAQRFAAEIEGKVFVITGATGGLGKETVRVLAKHGGTVVMLGRGKERLEALTADIKKVCGDKAQIQSVSCDLASLESVREAAAEVVRAHSKVHCLINNAGVMECPPAITADGMEMQFGCNVAAHFLLAQLVMPSLERAGAPGCPARVVNVSSCRHTHVPSKTELDFAQFTSLRGYSASIAYGVSKLCNVLHARELNRRCDEAGSNVVAMAVHPGVIPTGLFRHQGFADWILSSVFARPFVKTVPQGAATQTYVATAPITDLSPGEYYADCNVSPSSALSKDMTVAGRLWTEMCRLTSWDEK
eukprot:PhM_4_TR17031/c0_g1_i1/m.40789